MLKNLAMTFVKKALYSCAGAFALWLVTVNQTAAPSDAAGAELWRLAIVPLVTGLAALVRRFATYDPSKAS